MTQRNPLGRDEIRGTVVAYFKSLPKHVQRLQRNYQAVYMSSGITTYYGSYIARAIKTTALAFPVALVPTLLITILLLRMDIILSTQYSIITAAIAMVLTAAVFYAYPFYIRNENKNKIENGLIYFLSYMTALSASGMTIERILDRITEVETNPPLILLAKKFMMDVRLFGMDVRGALKDIAQMSPSQTLSKQLEGIRTVLATSGDLKGLLTYEVDTQIKAKKEQLKAKVNTLVYLGELYVAIMVVTPILFILIISILSIMGTSAIAGSPVLQMNLIVFVGIPILALTFTIILDQTLGSED